MTITTEEFKRVADMIKNDPCDQKICDGGYGETCVSYQMKLPISQDKVPFTHLELLDRYDCADGVMLGSKIIAKDAKEQLVLAETEIPMSGRIITSFWEDDHQCLDELEMKREMIIRAVAKKQSRMRAA